MDYILNKRRIRWVFSTLFALGTSLGLLAQSPEAKPTIFDRMYQEEPLRVGLIFDFEDLEAHRRTEEEFDGIFQFEDAEGNIETWKVELNVRGRYRRLHCDFPPLKLDFDKSDLRDGGMLDFDKLKLVTHCVDEVVGNEYVLREYLAYRLYNVLTHVSYRAQLVEITYRDSGSDRAFTRFGIILEDEDELAERLESELCEDCYGVPEENFNRNLAQLHDLYQFLIGNTDWSSSLLRNVKLLKPKDGSKFYLVPYDFDFSGIVNAHYVTIPDHLGISNVRERVYMGFPHDASAVEHTVTYMESKKRAMLKEVDKLDYFSRQERKGLKNYVRGFFNQYADSEELVILAENPVDLLNQD